MSEPTVTIVPAEPGLRLLRARLVEAELCAAGEDRLAVFEYPITAWRIESDNDGSHTTPVLPGYQPPDLLEMVDELIGVADSTGRVNDLDGISWPWVTAWRNDAWEYLCGRDRRKAVKAESKARLPAGKSEGP